MIKLRLENIMEDFILENLNRIFIYPTDTIYGLGCDAENDKLVSKIRKIKNRDEKPFLIIVPSVNYVLENFEADEKQIKEYLPGPYTLILKKKEKNFLSFVSDSENMGIRIPLHPFTSLLQKTKKPIVTTSVNISGEKPANCVEEIDERISKRVDLIIDGGVLSGKPSTLIYNGKIIHR